MLSGGSIASWSVDLSGRDRVTVQVVESTKSASGSSVNDRWAAGVTVRGFRYRSHVDGEPRVRRRSTGSLNVTVMLAPTATSVAPLTGEVDDDGRALVGWMGFGRGRP